MKDNNSFFRFFINGFTGKVETHISKYNDPIKYIDKAFSLVENSFKKMSIKNETDKKLLYKK